MDELRDIFDSSELLQSGSVHGFGKRISLYIKRPSKALLKDITILKSDVSYVTIPDLDLEEGPGTGRFTTLGDILTEMGDKISSSFFPGVQRFLDKLDEVCSGREKFNLVIDDPIALSSIRYTGDSLNDDFELEEEEYERTWDQNEELGLLQTEMENEFEDEKSIQRLAELILKSNKIVGFTGAGVSVESGVPSYRGSGDDSVWTKYDPSISDYKNFMGSTSVQESYWKMKTEFYTILESSQPNPSHQIFSFLEKHNKLSAIITQNIDQLHERAGVSQEKIISLHGTEGRVSCVDCKKQFDREEFHQRILKDGDYVQKCPSCSGVIRPCTTLFGEPLVESVVNRSREILSEECDLLLVIGSSLVVRPANYFPSICLDKKIPVVIINKEGETKYDKVADLVIRRPSGEVMKETMAFLEGKM